MDINSQVYTDFLSELKQFVPSDRIYTDELRTLGCPIPNPQSPIPKCEYFKLFYIEFFLF